MEKAPPPSYPVQQQPQMTGQPMPPQMSPQPTGQQPIMMQPMGQQPPQQFQQYPSPQGQFSPQPQQFSPQGPFPPQGPPTMSPQGQQPPPMQQQGSQMYKTAMPITSLTSAAAPVDCPACGQRAMTATTFITGSTVHLWAAIACVCLCLGCIPYLMTGLKDVKHTCSKCGAQLATWHRSGNTEVHIHG